ncbi:MAG: 3-methyl-2-oxobutanoate hydroxymethyltransferase [Candidatus Lambdaproteobacteria bacterium RIFOXYD1_FULL_56_27]|uniref:3-methyl-2-oxobutanoate hydroxymethyltransferase n=1 Tax=Candidatus Lambdaproteobacteria bacterium RIFOXYD2_FULL_56_26 TaxID=1817773 RepID=A0A1F6H300_9PROT|nr:MAG: 3-methyl-2-oxobutanoate hydroxymethyltransferase [Candidatus Lambdaproteobacteria bacterium RIFOXYD2_FULL_56_26]OGH05345.1 MAG: 3-methyl-2-oxobutanoate hydroxymethyltransferase [Candidatus Lambdaproteobacteria bacterium RIFOXYC1_FULL_56_13]OGH09187.1 MAG: 3-methyl-2-oxobutanoate hydroxymethyltransferase [Candidatus Lambdaproteobacteria bacterium RIFOXYD1_FULL_56_27]
MPRKTVPALAQQKGVTPLVVLTAYDYSQARLVDGIVDVILVGDSLGMVVAGLENTLAVTLDQMIYHCSLVARGAKSSLLVGDMPFLSYQVSPEQALESAGRFVAQAGMQSVKLEGGIDFVPQIKKIVAAGIPVMGHLGMQPQWINLYGGYGKQAKTEASAQKLLEEALALEKAGIWALVLENIPHETAHKVSQALSIPTIGIGAGPHCDGQVQVWHDLFGLDPEFAPRHAVRFRELGKEMKAGAEAYAQAVKTGQLLSK